MSHEGISGKELLGTKLKNAYPKNIIDKINLISLNNDKKYTIVGSASYLVQKYYADIDVIQEFVGKNFNDILNKFIKNLKSVINKIDSTDLIYFSDFKAGIDERYAIDVGTLRNGLYTPSSNLSKKVKELFEKELLNPTEYASINDALKFTNSLSYDIISETLRLRKIVRWKQDEISKGWKMLPGKVKYELKKALTADTTVKLDTIIVVNNNFLELTNVVLLGEKSGNKIKYYDSKANNLRANTVEFLKEDVEKLYYSELFYSPFKASKRLFSLIRLMVNSNIGDEEDNLNYIEEILPLITEDTSLLYQQKSFLEACDRLISIGVTLPEKTFKKQLDNIKFILPTCKILSKAQVKVANGIIEKMETAKKGEKKKYLDLLITELTRTINVYTDIYLKENDLIIVPKVYLPAQLKYLRVDNLIDDADEGIISDTEMNKLDEILEKGSKDAIKNAEKMVKNKIDQQANDNKVVKEPIKKADNLINKKFAKDRRQVNKIPPTPVITSSYEQVAPRRIRRDDLNTSIDADKISIKETRPEETKPIEINKRKTKREEPKREEPLPASRNISDLISSEEESFEEEERLEEGDLYPSIVTGKYIENAMKYYIHNSIEEFDPATGVSLQDKFMVLIPDFIQYISVFINLIKEDLYERQVPKSFTNSINYIIQTATLYFVSNYMYPSLSFDSIFNLFDVIAHNVDHPLTDYDKEYLREQFGAIYDNTIDDIDRYVDELNRYAPEGQLWDQEIPPEHERRLNAEQQEQNRINDVMRREQREQDEAIARAQEEERKERLKKEQAKEEARRIEAQNRERELVQKGQEIFDDEVRREKSKKDSNRAEALAAENIKREEKEREKQKDLGDLQNKLEMAKNEFNATKNELTNLVNENEVLLNSIATKTNALNNLKGNLRAKLVNLQLLEEEGEAIKNERDVKINEKSQTINSEEEKINEQLRALQIEKDRIDATNDELDERITEYEKASDVLKQAEERLNEQLTIMQSVSEEIDAKKQRIDTMSEQEKEQLEMEMGILEAQQLSAAQDSNRNTMEKERLENAKNLIEADKAARAELINRYNEITENIEALTAEKDNLRIELETAKSQFDNQLKAIVDNHTEIANEIRELEEIDRRGNEEIDELRLKIDEQANKLDMKQNELKENQKKIDTIEELSSAIQGDAETIYQPEVEIIATPDDDEVKSRLSDILDNYDEAEKKKLLESAEEFKKKLEAAQQPAKQTDSIPVDKYLGSLLDPEEVNNFVITELSRGVSEADISLAIGANLLHYLDGILVRGMNEKGITAETIKKYYPHTPIHNYGDIIPGSIIPDDEMIRKIIGVLNQTPIDTSELITHVNDRLAFISDPKILEQQEAEIEQKNKMREQIVNKFYGETPDTLERYNASPKNLKIKLTKIWKDILAAKVGQGTKAVPLIDVLTGVRKTNKGKLKNITRDIVNKVANIFNRYGFKYEEGYYADENLNFLQLAYLDHVFDPNKDNEDNFKNLLTQFRFITDKIASERDMASSLRAGMEAYRRGRIPDDPEDEAIINEEEKIQTQRHTDLIMKEKEEQDKKREEERERMLEDIKKKRKTKKSSGKK